jgi:hypothetical protein
VNEGVRFWPTIAWTQLARTQTNDAPAAYSLSVSRIANRPNGESGWNDPPLVIDVTRDGLPARLAPFENMVLEFTLDDGTSQSGVLVTLDESSVILERWDSGSHGPNGDLFTVSLDSIRQVVVQ